MEFHVGREFVWHSCCICPFYQHLSGIQEHIREKLVLMLPWRIPFFPQLPCDGCPLDRPKHCRGAQRFSGWTHPVWLARGFSAAAGWLDCTGTPAPRECWSYTESSSSSSGPGVGWGGGHRPRHRSVEVKIQNCTSLKHNKHQTSLKTDLIIILMQAFIKQNTVKNLIN